MTTFYETIKTTLAIAIIAAFCCASAFAAEGIDSALGSDLPLNSQGTLVATLRSVNGSGLLDIKNGAKIGTVDAALCDETVDSAVALSNKGLIRYDTSTDALQYCNGKTWKAAFAASSENYGGFLGSCAASNGYGGYPSTSGKSPICYWVGCSPKYLSFTFLYFFLYSSQSYNQQLFLPARGKISVVDLC